MQAIYVDKSDCSWLKRRLKTKCGFEKQSSTFELALNTHIKCRNDTTVMYYIITNIIYYYCAVVAGYSG